MGLTMPRTSDACPEMVDEIERVTSQRDARADVISRLAREVADLRCTLREIRDSTSEPSTRDLAASRLVE